MAYDIATINTMLNAPSTTQRSFSDAGVYGCLQNTYSLGNLVGFKSTTPGGSGYQYTTHPTPAYCYLAVGGDGIITITNGTSQYWFYLFGSGYNGNAYEVYCQTGDGYGNIFGDTRDAWITVGTYRQWYIGGTGAHGRTFYLYFRNTYFAQTNPGTFVLTAESQI